jgi:eukaryotic-like serine/threonine-protein kinase
MAELARGTGTLLFGRWKPAEAALARAEDIFRNHCTGVAWERDTGHTFMLRALFEMGRIAELGRRWTVLYRVARERGEPDNATDVTSFFATIVKLAANERPETEGRMEAFLGARGDRPVNLRHMSAFDSLVHIDLYRGEVTRAWARLCAIWPEYTRSMLFRVQLIRIQMLGLRARTAVAAAERAQQAAPLLKQAERDARRLEREGQDWAVAHAHYVRAAIAACREDAVAACEELSKAADLYDRADMELSAHLMRYRLGQIAPNDETRQRRDRAELWLQEQGIAAPARWAGTFAPGFGRISTETTETSF